VREELLIRIVLVVLQELPNLVVGLYNIFSKDKVDIETVNKIREIVRSPELYFTTKDGNEK
jgi:hypothetical protein